MPLPAVLTRESVFVELLAEQSNNGVVFRDSVTDTVDNRDILDRMLHECNIEFARPQHSINGRNVLTTNGKFDLFEIEAIGIKTIDLYFDELFSESVDPRVATRMRLTDLGLERAAAADYDEDRIEVGLKNKVPVGGGSGGVSGTTPPEVQALIDAAENARTLLRDDSIAGVAPTLAEWAEPTQSDVATVSLNNGVTEYWRYDSGAWSLIRTVGVVSDPFERVNNVVDLIPGLVPFGVTNYEALVLSNRLWYITRDGGATWDPRDYHAVLDTSQRLTQRTELVDGQTFYILDVADHWRYTDVDGLIRVEDSGGSLPTEVQQGALDPIDGVSGNVPVALGSQFRSFSVSNLAGNTDLVITHDINIVEVLIQVNSPNGFNLTATVNGSAVSLVGYDASSLTPQEFNIRRFEP